MILLSLDCLGLTEHPDEQRFQDERRFQAVYDVGTYEIVIGTYRSTKNTEGDPLEYMNTTDELERMMLGCTDTALEMQAIFRETFSAARALNIGERWRRGAGIEPIPGR